MGLIARVAALLLVAHHASAIDFDALACTGTGNSSTGGSYSEAGFDLTALNNGHFQYFCDTNSLYTGSGALFFGTPGMSARLVAAGGMPFDLVSIDLSRGFTAGGASIDFVGYLEGGGTVNQSFQSPTNIPLVTFNFSGFTSLVRLEWSEEFHLGHQFDNIVVTLVPEPSTFALVGAGLFLLGRLRNPIRSDE